MDEIQPAMIIYYGTDFFLSRFSSRQIELAIMESESPQIPRAPILPSNDQAYIYDPTTSALILTGPGRNALLFVELESARFPRVNGLTAGLGRPDSESSLERHG